MPTQVSRPAVLSGTKSPAAHDAHSIVVKRWSNAKVTWRAFLALLLLFGFYILALAIVGILLVFTWIQWQGVRQGGRVFPILALISPLVALGILCALLPRTPAWHDPGPRLNPKTRTSPLRPTARDLPRNPDRGEIDISLDMWHRIDARSRDAVLVHGQARRACICRDGLGKEAVIPLKDAARGQCQVLVAVDKRGKEHLEPTP